MSEADKKREAQGRRQSPISPWGRSRHFGDAHDELKEAFDWAPIDILSWRGSRSKNIDAVTCVSTCGAG
jgi:hypothetical protein